MLTTLALLSALALPTQEPSHLVRIASSVPAPILAERLEAEGYDVFAIAASDDPTGPAAVEVVTSAAERAQLEARGLTLEFVTKGRPLADILAEQSELDGVPSGYLDNAGVLAEMAAYEASYPNLAQLVDLTMLYGTPPTVEGRHIYALKISDNVQLEEDEPAFLMVSAHHCREIVTPVLALDSIDRLLTGYASDPVIQAAVDGHEIWIAPVWNPDGYDHVFTGDNLWRKNRRIFSGGVGVDLNRNYSFNWTSGCSGSTSPSSSTYKGPSQASEAETLTMEAFSADQRFAKVLDFHSSGRETLWGYACPTSPIDTFWRSMAIQLSQASGYNGDERRPSADGEHYHWQFGARGVMAFLTETATSFQPSYASAQAEAATVWPGTLWLLARDVQLTGQVTDSCSGAPIAATIEVLNLSFTQGEQFTAGGSFGRYDAFLPGGTHTLRFEAPGYSPRTEQVTVAAGGGSTYDIALDPVGATGTVYCNGTANSTGNVPLIYAVGSPSVTQNQFSLFAELLPGLQPARFFMGQNLVNRPVFNGVLCIGRPSFRFGAAPSDLFGTTSQVVDFTQPVHPLAVVTAGSTWGFQVVYRDPAAGGSGLNYSPGLSITFCP